MHPTDNYSTYYHALLKQNMDHIAKAIYEGDYSIDKFVAVATIALSDLEKSLKEEKNKDLKTYQMQYEDLKGKWSHLVAMQREMEAPAPPMTKFEKAKSIAITCFNFLCDTVYPPTKDDLKQRLAAEGNNLENRAIKFFNLHQKQIKEHATILTEVHKLFEQASHKFLEAGDYANAFRVRSWSAFFIHFSDTHPLHDMNKTIAIPAKHFPESFLGVHFSGLDSGVLKGGHLRGTARTVGKENFYRFHFDISHFARQEMQNNLMSIIDNLQIFQSSLPEDFCKNIHIEVADHLFQGKDNQGRFSNVKGYHPPGAKVFKITFEGIGTVAIGCSPEWGSLYNQVTVEMPAEKEPGEGLRSLHQMLTVLGLGPILSCQTQEDDKRIKVFQLFRAYFPAQALQMERSKKYYEMTTEQLIQEISINVKGMEAIFNKYLVHHPELMRKNEIIPGKLMWTVTDLSTQMRKKGAWGLMSGIGEASFESGCEVLCSLLETGPLSSYDRFLAGLFKPGASSEEDLSSGGANQVFTCLITEKMAEVEIERFAFHRHMQVLYDLDVVNRVSYGYPVDLYGVKNVADEFFGFYANRKNLIDFADNLSSGHVANEVMVKNRIDPSFIIGVVVPTEQHKKVLIEFLSKKKLVEERGKELYINGRPIHKFVHVSSKFSKEMWKKNE